MRGERGRGEKEGGTSILGLTYPSPLLAGTVLKEA